MNPMDRYLDRLLRSAAGSPARPGEAYSLATEARVLAALRSARASFGSEAANLISLFRRGLAIAGACAAVAVLLSLSLQSGDPDLLTASEDAFAYELAAR